MIEASFYIPGITNLPKCPQWTNRQRECAVCVQWNVIELLKSVIHVIYDVCKSERYIT